MKYFFRKLVFIYCLPIDLIASIIFLLVQASAYGFQNYISTLLTESDLLLDDIENFTTKYDKELNVLYISLSTILYIYLYFHIK